MDIYSKPTDSKHYVSYFFNHLKPYLKNITFCLARRICAIAENGNVKYMKFKLLTIILKTEKYPQMLIEKWLW